tara:strand:+ start:255 stop:1352 length:1098 start_codon:yes stop_codon:yes gene_type:complete
MPLSRVANQGLTGPIGGRRNVVTNGLMNVAQRATSATGLGASDGFFTVDRFKMLFNNTAGRLTMEQVADGPSGFANAIKLSCTTADTSIAADEFAVIEQRLEGQDLQRFMKGTSDAKEYALSFYVKGNASATYVIELYDNDNNRQVSKQFSVTTSWSRVELIFPADTTGAFDDDANTSLIIFFWLHAGSDRTSGTLSETWTSVTNANRAVGINSFFSSTDNTFFVTGLQLEVGSVATEFEHRSFGEELALCQRYFIRYPSLADGSVNLYYALGMIHSSTTAFYHVNLPVPMRTQPDLSISGADDFTSVDSGTIRNLTNLTLLGDLFIDEKAVVLQGTATFSNEDRPSMLRGDGTSGGHFALDAEL